jgi:cellulose synthase/poly-beta-1,6-N-acetylglucosamine synthase-like glycosyltransferase
MEFLAPGLTAAYSVVCALLALLGAYRLVLLAAGLGSRRRAGPEPPPPTTWPRVTVQLPLYNERFVARRLLEAVARLDYPAARIEIQVLDDSTDRTATFMRRGVRLLRRRGLDAVYVHRPERSGFKAGALANGLRTARGELVAIFDADFVPPADFLRRLVPVLLQPGVGVVQARWGHLNRDSSWFTRLQAVLLDGHFALEQPARHARGWLLTFNGTAGIWRRRAIEDAGGWTSDTLTEDLDLSFRAQLAGWRIAYRQDVLVPAELPVDPQSFRAQQRRWTKGGVQVARKLVPRVLQSGLDWRLKLEAVLHLSSYAGYPLLVLLALLHTPVHAWTTSRSYLGLLPGELVLLALGTLPLAVFYALAQRAAGGPGSAWDRGRDILPAMALGAGLAVGNALAVVEGLFGRGAAFERTPKRGIVGERVPAGTARGARAALALRRRMAGYRAQGTRVALVELLLLVYLVSARLWSRHQPFLGEFPFLSFFAFGLLAMSVRSLRPLRERGT